MAEFPSSLDRQAEAYARNARQMQALLSEIETLEQRTLERSARAGAAFRKAGKLLPRERLAALLDPGTPFLELMKLAGYCGIEDPDPATSVPGAAIIGGIGTVCGVQCMLVINDAGISAGAMQAMTGQKVMRCQEIALAHGLPFIQLVESAGGNLKKYRVERFVNGGGMFYNLARLSAAGVPVISLVHGASTAGGAYLPGLSDYVVMVRGQARAFLAGPSLLKAATGEEATEEELGGADMHAGVSGVADYVANNDHEAIEAVREIVRALRWRASAQVAQAPAPRYPAEELLGLMPTSFAQPVDMREILARIVDASDLHEFKAGYGSQTVCGYAAVHGMPIGFITNNGPLDSPGSNKAAQFIQLCTQLGRPIVFLQNITGFVVGRAHEEAGIIKHGAKLIQALSSTDVPRITILCGASFGAGNYGMCGRAFRPDFLFSWPNARTAVMGGEQAAMTMRRVAESRALRAGEQPDQARLDAESADIVDTFERQASAIHTSSLMLDDGVIDPRLTREVLAVALAACTGSAEHPRRPMQFGVARF